MTLRDFASTYTELTREHGPLTAVRYASREARQRLQRAGTHAKPDGVPDQSALLDVAFDSDGPVWVLWFDGGRLDGFRKLYGDYFTGQLRACWNGGIGYSGDWADRHLRRDLSGYGLFSVAPVRSLSGTDYDGREYFTVAPEIDTGDTVNERLAALGYRELKDDGVVDISPGHCNRSVRDHRDVVDSGVIRYLKPHPPFDGIEGLTSGSGKTRTTWHALWSGAITEGELRERYRATYRQAFEAAREIVPELEGDIYITADHGECLGDCGQLFHASTHATHDHLCVVPWLRVEAVKG